jgi:hypothetical protein
MMGYKGRCNFGECPKGEVRRIPIPRTSMDKGKIKDRGRLEKRHPSGPMIELLEAQFAARSSKFGQFTHMCLYYVYVQVPPPLGAGHLSELHDMIRVAPPALCEGSTHC